MFSANEAKIVTKAIKVSNKDKGYRHFQLKAKFQDGAMHVTNGFCIFSVPGFTDKDGIIVDEFLQKDEMSNFPTISVILKKDYGIRGVDYAQAVHVLSNLSGFKNGKQPVFFDPETCVLGKRGINLEYFTSFASILPKCSVVSIEATKDKDIYRITWVNGATLIMATGAKLD